MCEMHEKKSGRECTDSTRSCMPRTNVGVSFLRPCVLVIELRSLSLCIKHFYPLGHLITTAPPKKIVLLRDTGRKVANQSERLEKSKCKEMHA